MKNKHLIAGMTAALLAIGIAGAVRAADDNDAKDVNATRRELREKLKNMAPEERRAAIKAWREKHPDQVEQLRKRREEFKNLTTEEREAKRKEMRGKLGERVAELEKKRADGTITDLEKQRLDRMKHLLNNAERLRAGKQNGGKPAADKNPEGRPASEK